MSNASSPGTPGQPRWHFGYRQNPKDTTQYLYGPIRANSLQVQAPQPDAVPASTVDAAAKPALQDTEQPAGKPLATESE